MNSLVAGRPAGRRGRDRRVARGARLRRRQRHRRARLRPEPDRGLSVTPYAQDRGGRGARPAAAPARHALPDTRAAPRAGRGRPRAPRRLRPRLRLRALRHAAGDLPARARVPARDGADGGARLPVRRARARPRRATRSSSCARCDADEPLDLRVWAEQPAPTTRAVARSTSWPRRRVGRRAGLARPQHVPAPRGGGGEGTARQERAEPPEATAVWDGARATSAAATPRSRATATRSTCTACPRGCSASRARSRTACGRKARCLAALQGHLPDALHGRGRVQAAGAAAGEGRVLDLGRRAPSGASRCTTRAAASRTSRARSALRLPA